MPDCGLYVHIPFCVRKCRYCDFCSFEGKLDAADAYVDALLREADLLATSFRDTTMETLFFGGGTPSLLTETQMGRLMAGLRQRFTFAKDAETSFEANPGTVTEGKLAAFREAGLNRVSFGVQAVQDRLLARLGRIHRFREAQEALTWAKAAGFDRINVDLMTGLPGQEAGDLAESLAWALGEGAGHISLYSLIVEEGTPFFAEAEAGTLALPEEAEERAWFAAACEQLRRAGLERYEISNFARPGDACRHNLRYWRRQPYLGLGVAAVSMRSDARRKNPEMLETYMTPLAEGRLPEAEIETISPQDQAFETVMLGLRMAEGVNLAVYGAQYGDDAESTLRRCGEKWQGMGLARMEQGRLSLTDAGMDLQNPLLVEFWEALDSAAACGGTRNDK